MKYILGTRWTYLIEGINWWQSRYFKWNFIYTATQRPLVVLLKKFLSTTLLIWGSHILNTLETYNLVVWFLKIAGALYCLSVTSNQWGIRSIKQINKGDILYVILIQHSEQSHWDHGKSQCSILSSYSEKVGRENKEPSFKSKTICQC